MAMPKTAMNEDNLFQPRKHQVGDTKEAIVMQSVPES
jgi:hypothetical protein